MPRAARVVSNLSTNLTVAESRFVSEYLIDGNGARAAVDAGWCERGDPKKASALAFHLTKQPRILNAINEQMQATAKRNLITIDRLLFEAYRLATYDIAEAFDAQGQPRPISDIPEDLRRAIEGFETEQVLRGAVPTQVTRYKFAKKTVALQMLFEQLIGAVKRLEVTGRNGVPLFAPKSDLTEISTELLEKIVAMGELKDAAIIETVPIPPVVNPPAPEEPKK